ncbi:MAG TPA: type II toxin-antitoxin system RelE/ParE family toxin [Haliscomenobacter sp.]|uniref:type II toxin-antitoxin system RelE/ParE family toxin n=1 Tax=Haliscomenobacter sp. TaxID=2717303 RepID=UPI002D0B7261|nr:type II toxin-antitoxin system RelE/ParE family toxin [Haliscomenobacter sp.]HOY15903.1 type II toxin-antitoxin system RelE/ParE family toxin [Haliscomenobacter sp.]
MVNAKYRVIVSNPAQKRLRAIFTYLNENSSTETAQKVRKSLLETVKSLEKMPQRRSVLPGTEDMNPPYRYTKKWSYKIVFKIVELKKEVRVLDFFHEKQNPDKLKKLIK